MNVDQAGLPHLPVLHAQRFSLLRGGEKKLFSGFLAGDISRLDQLFQRIRHHVGIFHVQHKADVGQLFLAVAVIHVVQKRNVKGPHIRFTRSGHAAHHPFVKRIAGHDQRIFQL